MKKYENLTDAEVQKYQSMLVLPNIDYPHYQPLIIDGIIVHDHQDINSIKGEQFVKSNYLKNENAKELSVSNYGRVIYNNELLKPFIVGTFLHCLKVYIKSEFYVHRIVKETFDPVENMNTLEVHHINNNALDNRPENLLWVSKEDHSKIHAINLKFTQDIMSISRKIYEKNKNDLLELFNKNLGKAFTGKELIDAFSNVSRDVIKNNTYALAKETIIFDATEKNTIFNNKRFYKLSEEEEQYLKEFAARCLHGN